MNVFNSKITGSRSASPTDSQNNLKLLHNKSRYPPFTGRGIDSPTSDPFDMDSPLIRYSRSVYVPPAIDSGKFHQLLLQQHSNLSSSSSSPLSAIENLETPPSRSPPLFSTPVKVEEDVLVMDGILVGSSPGNRGRPAMESGSSYKTEICRTWEDFGNCRYGSKCQFAHGKEDLRPIGNSSNSKQEPNYWPGAVAKKMTAAVEVRSTCGTKDRSNETHYWRLGMKSRMKKVVMEQQPQQQEVSGTKDWCPEDDGIVVCTSREALDKYINNVLYGPPRTRRLPVFTEFCPE